VDIGSSIADTFSAPDYGVFFADGGLVSRKAPGYADGGEVKTRNTYAPPGRSNHIINSINVEDVARARYNYSSTQANRKALAEAYEVTRRALAQPEAGAGRGTGYRKFADGGAIGARSSGTSESASAPGTLAINSTDAVFGPTPGTGNSGGPSPAVDPLAQLSEDVLSYFAVDEAAGNSGWQAPQTPLVKGDITYERLPATSNMGGEAFYGQEGMDTGFGNSIMGRPTDYDRKAGTGAIKYDAATGAKTGLAGIKPEVNPAMDFISAAITAASMAMGNPALAFARSVGGRTLMEGAKTGFASGGEVDGPGTGTSDSIVARLSDGEYVVPADVVEMLGVEFFDGLRDAFHTPVSMQRYHASGTTRNEQR